MKKACKTLLICILAILILALAQTFALLAGEMFVKAGLPGICEPVIDAVISGGDFGVESSIIAIAGYVIVCVIALVLGRKCGDDKQRSY